MHRTFFLIILVLHSVCGFGQKNYNLKIVDDESKNPIFGAYLSIGNHSIGFSNDYGSINFDPEKYSSNDSICISHISYETKCIDLKSLEGGTIKMVYKENMLEEITLSYQGDIPSVKSIIKEAKKHFQHSRAQRESYWSTMNFKTVPLLNHKPQGYVEIDGSIFMNDDFQKKSMFWIDAIVPNEIRRLEESNELASISPKWKEKTGVRQMSTHFTSRDLLFANRVNSRLHPLDKKTGKFKYNFLKEETMNGKDCYVIEYSRSGKMELKGREFKKFYGKLWIDKSNYALVKEEASYHFETLTSNTLTNTFILIDNVIYPKEMKAAVHHTNNTKIGSSKSILTFKKINTTPNQYIGMDGGTAHYFYFKHFSYNKDYWLNNNLESNPFKEDLMKLTLNQNLDDLFIQGANSKVYSDNPQFAKSEFYKNFWEDLVEMEMNQVRTK